MPTQLFLRRRVATLGCVLAGSVLAACSFTIPRLDPTPTIAIPPQPQSLTLVLAPAIEDHFSAPVGRYTMHVDAWRATLESGFKSGFEKAFPAKPGATPDLTLEIDEAHPEVGQSEHAQAKIRYVATLSGRDGTVRRTSGVASRAAPYGFPGTTDLVDADVSASVAAMYEQIAKELFPDMQPTSSAPRACVPGQSSACVGPKACQGFQVCAKDGTRYDPCSCGN